MPPIAVTEFHQPTNNPPRAVVSTTYQPSDGLIHLETGHAARFEALPCIVSCVASPGDAESAVLTHLKITSANTGADTISVQGPTDGYTDVTLPAGTVIDIRVVAELTSEIHAAVNAIESFLNTGAALYACRFVLGSPAATGTDVVPWLQIPANGTIRKATITAKTEPVGADMIVDIRYSENDGSTWSSIWAAPGDRLTLTAGDHAGSTTTFGHASLAQGNLLRLDVIQVGSTTPGSDVVIDLWIVFPSPP